MCDKKTLNISKTIEAKNCKMKCVRDISADKQAVSINSHKIVQDHSDLKQCSVCPPCCCKTSIYIAHAWAKYLWMNIHNVYNLKTKMFWAGGKNCQWTILAVTPLIDGAVNATDLPHSVMIARLSCLWIVAAVICRYMWVIKTVPFLFVA